ncbi:WD40 repeat-like protein [Coprinopsis marcescibilis]|uniref:WD40 repeat-like protein n=1 Tax=Coprinopsis marcescibilis TaxID=230819 RepID=A0A5C3L7J7_COPMA|nr:WD40 repeat-like protein [Coprinopsis marcescibilis]
MLPSKAPQLLPSPTYRLSSDMLKSRTESPWSGDTDREDFIPPYVLHIASLPSHYAIATSAPSNTLSILDKHTLDVVQRLGELRSGFRNEREAHEGGITGVKAFENFMGERRNGLLSCGKDGKVVVWDDRAGPGGEGAVKFNALGMNSKPRSVLACDISRDGMLVAAGTELQGDEAAIVYWDPRKPSAPIHQHTATHSDDVTVIAFAPDDVKFRPAPSSRPSTPIAGGSGDVRLILSGSSDGLLSLSNANEDDEDEAMLATANWGCSIAQAGWIGSKGVWAGSDMETFSTWSADLEPRLNFSIREPADHSRPGPPWVTDYLVGCHTSKTGDGKKPSLSVFVGSNEGDVSLISTKNPVAKSKSKKQEVGALAPWTLHSTWSHGHIGIVRSILYDEEKGLVITGGEDAKLRVWKDHTEYKENDADMDMVDENDEQEGGDNDEMMVSPAGSQKTSSNWRKRDLDSDGDDAMDEKEGKRRRND